MTITFLNMLINSKILIPNYVTTETKGFTVTSNHIKVYTYRRPSRSQTLGSIFFSQHLSHLKMNQFLNETENLQMYTNTGILQCTTIYILVKKGLINGQWKNVPFLVFFSVPQRRSFKITIVFNANAIF